MLHRLVCLALLVLLAACAATPANLPKNRPQTAEPSAREPVNLLSDTVVALSFSGGGLRAAAFADGVLEGLREQRSSLGRTLLDDVGFITSVSGGSITAAYFGLHGPEGLKGFREKVLLRDGEAGLRTSLLNPVNLVRLLSGGLNDRSNLNDWLERDVFQGATFGDVFRRGRPVVWINATNAQYRLAFPFHERAFEAICSDLASFPVSEAVAASMAVPLVFAPVVLEKFPEHCQRPLPAAPEVLDAARQARDPQYRLRTALLRALKDFRDPKAGRYLKLMDGGLTDNLGLVSILQSRILLNTPYGPIGEHDAAAMRRMLFIVVDAGQGPSSDWGREVAGPSGVEIAGAAVDTAIESTMRMSYSGFATMARQWERDIIAFRCGLPEARQEALRAFHPGWRCDDVQFSVTQISFADLPEAEEAALNAIPTRLKLPPAQIDQLISAGVRAVQQDAGVQAFSRAVAGDK